MIFYINYMHKSKRYIRMCSINTILRLNSYRINKSINGIFTNITIYLPESKSVVNITKYDHFT